MGNLIVSKAVAEVVTKITIIYATLNIVVGINGKAHHGNNKLDNIARLNGERILSKDVEADLALRGELCLFICKELLGNLSTIVSTTHQNQYIAVAVATADNILDSLDKWRETSLTIVYRNFGIAIF